MHLKRLLAMMAVLLAVPFLLAACGGDDADDDGDITEAIETAATSTDAAACTEVMTQAFNEQTQFESGEEAIESCESDADDPTAESVEVSNISVDGDSATAETAFTGGDLAGQTLVISLVKEDGDWKLDQLDSFVGFDQASFADAIAGSVAEDGDTPPQVGECVVEAAQQADPQQLQDIYLSGDPSQLIGLFGGCFNQ